MDPIDQAVMSLKAACRGNEDVNVPNVQGHDDVKSSEAVGRTNRLPGGASHPSHDDVKSSAGRQQVLR